MKFNLLLILTLLLGTVGCKTTVYSTGNVVFQSVSNGVIAMRCVGLGKNREEAWIDAEKNAISVLLFRGLSKSGQEMPLLTINEVQFKSDYPVYWDRMFGTLMRYKTFVVASIPVTDLQKQEHGRKCLTLDVKINLRSLRLDLEKQGLIRRFGY